MKLMNFCVAKISFLKDQTRSFLKSSFEHLPVKDVILFPFWSHEFVWLFKLVTTVFYEANIDDDDSYNITHFTLLNNYYFKKNLNKMFVI